MIFLPLIIGVTVTICMFLFAGLASTRKAISINQYFIFPRQATSKRLFASFMSSSLSMASTVIVFLQWGSDPDIGVATIYSPLLWACGILLLYLLYKSMLPFLLQYKTLHGFLEYVYGDPKLRKIAAMATLTGFLGQFGVEILVGTSILQIAGAHVISKPILFGLGFGIMSIVLAYSWMGGFLSVLKTDFIQYYIISVAFTITALFAFSDSPVLVLETIHLSMVNNLGNPGFGWLTVLSLACLNIPLLVTDMSVWQRLASSDNEEGAKQAIRGYAGGLIFIASIVILLGIMFQIPGVIPVSEGASHIGRLVLYLSNSPVLLTIFAAGIVAAILSAADTFLLAACQTWLTDIANVPELRDRERYEKTDIDPDAERPLLQMARRTNAVLAIATFCVCYFLWAILEVDILSILFAVFAAQISLSPGVIYGLAKGRGGQGDLQSLRYKARFSIFGGYGLVIGLLVASVIWIKAFNGDPEIVKSTLLWNAPIYVTVLSWTLFAVAPVVRRSHTKVIVP